MNLKRIIKHESFAGLLLLISFILATIISNTSLYPYYLKIVHLPIVLQLGSLISNTTLLHLVDEGLMTLFFLLIGLELKYHITEGEYRSKRKMMLPVTAAIGGFVMPALIYAYFNFGKPTMHGWAIPVATDTAFVLGLLSFFRNAISLDLRIFILGFSLFDDVLAVLVLGLFYTSDLNMTALALSLLIVIFLFILNRFKVNKLYVYLIVGFVLWLTILQSNIHGTLAGIILAFFIPVNAKKRGVPLSIKLEKGLHPIVIYFILPVFVFINSEVPIHKIVFKDIFSDLSLGIILGLLIGKQVGIFLFSYIVVQLKHCTLPENTSWAKYYAIALLSGIGFTLSIFIGSIAFEKENLVNTMRIAILIGSGLSAILGTLLLKFVSKPRDV